MRLLHESDVPALIPMPGVSALGANVALSFAMEQEYRDELSNV